MKTYRILTINPGSTTTKIALFEGENVVFKTTLEHPTEDLKQFATLADQKPYRMEAVMAVLRENNIDLATIDGFVGRGGGQESMLGGTYLINDLVYAHARDCYKANHPALLGSQIARDLADMNGKPSYIVNPPCTDEFIDEARVSGMKEIRRISHTHALNQKEMAYRYAAQVGKRYEDLNIVVAHLGGGVSITAHHKGRMIDSNDCLGSSGAFAPTRSGSVPAVGLVKMCFSGAYTEQDVLDRIYKNGGLTSYLGTSDVREVRARIASGDQYAKLILNAMIYQIKKEIGAMCAVLNYQVDAVILTGGVSNDSQLVENIRQSMSRLAPVVAMPGEFEMEAMAAGAIRVLSGEEEAKVYTGVPVFDANLLPGAIY